jgi:SAM-dependent methyltransferase
MALKQRLRVPEKQDDTDLDDPATTLLHAGIIKRKRFLRELYSEFYTIIRDRVPPVKTPVVIEIGSGGGFIKEIIPSAQTSDIMPVPGLDLCFSATDMPFEAQSVDCFCMINTLHHIPDPAVFFRECTRCLRPGGSVVMIEPANTLFSRLIYTRFHHEPFDPKAGWTLPPGGPLSMSNQAMPWIIFHRDRERFEREFPSLHIDQLRPHTPLRYLLSGGFSCQQLLPGLFYPVASITDRILLRPILPLTALFMTITLQRVDHN